MQKLTHVSGNKNNFPEGNNLHNTGNICFYVNIIEWYVVCECNKLVVISP